MLKQLKSVLVCSLAALLVVVVVGCGNSKSASSSNPEANTSGTKATDNGGANASSAGAKKQKIVIMPKFVGSAYFNASEKGALKAGKDLGVDVIYTGPTKGDAAEQVKMLEDLISKGVDAIAVAANDPAALSPVLKKAKDKGILILDWDTPSDPKVVDLSVHQIDDKAYAEHLWDKLVQSMGTDSGEYAVLTGGLSAANLNSWIDNGIAYAKQKYPNLKLVTDRIPTDEKQQVAYQKTLDLIKAYPNLKGIVGVSSPAPIGAAQAIQEKGLQNKISLVGATTPTDSKAYLNDGSMDVAVLWDPEKLGYLVAQLAKLKLDGKEITNGMDIPNVGKIELKEDKKTVIMGPSTDFTKENAGNYSF